MDPSCIVIHSARASVARLGLGPALELQLEEEPAELAEGFLSSVATKIAIKRMFQNLT